ncbi:hypothetical protein TeGR_g13606 [Tetraparma gracilis]|uniref:Uncharacterized protein n=1 Tax=Tetraparma gracilis TaxID=2962635 RepID=A0ABQ6MQV2_9STRA|nr:hypothetical protein TeGR_g13606 [Tetraparma gracilis]
MYQLTESGMDAVSNVDGHAGLAKIAFLADGAAGVAALEAWEPGAEGWNEGGAWMGTTPIGGISTPSKCDRRVEEGEFWIEEGTGLRKSPAQEE